MIFVTVGTNETPFDRLVRAVDNLELDEELVVQHGSSTVRPEGARCVDFLPFEELVEHVRRARLVVSHAGVGSVLVALSSGRRPIVVPRLRRFGEAVDDHQAAFAKRLHAAGMVQLVKDPGELRDALTSSVERLPPHARDEAGPNGLVEDLHEYLVSRLGTSTTR
jgi:UDP-N-acetylglucosamine transferase subunit ALG13